MKKKWYCYVCGKKVSKSYYLCSMSSETDRVFLVCAKQKCIEQVNPKGAVIIGVIENE